MRKATGSYRTLFIPSKTAIFVPEFEVKDLPLGRTAALVPEFAVTQNTLMMMMMMMMMVMVLVILIF